MKYIFTFLTTFSFITLFAQFDGHDMHERVFYFDQTNLISAGMDLASNPTDSASASFVNGMKNLVQHNGMFYQVYTDQRTGDNNIYFRSSADGIIWNTQVQVNDDSLFRDQFNASIVAFDSAGVTKIVVAWADYRGNFPQMRVAVSYDNGLTFLPSVEVSSHFDNVDISGTIAADSAGNIYLTWTRRNSAGQINETWFSSSADGLTWTPMTAIFPGNANSEPVAIVARDTGEVMVIISDEQLNKKNLIAMHSIDGGITWTANQFTNYNLLNEIGTFQSATVGPNGDVYLVYSYSANSINNDFLFTRSSDWGITWSTPVSIINGASLFFTYIFTGCMTPNIAITPTGTLYAVMSDTRFGNHINPDSANWDVYLTRSIDNGQTWMPNIMVNSDSIAMHQYCASVAVKSDGLIDTVLVVWTDDRATLSLNLSTSPSFPVFAVGPNPASYNLNLLSNANSYFDITISVIDATGRTIFPSKGIAGTPGISENLIDVSTLPSGFYFLKIDGSMNGKQFSRNEKFIIRRE